MGPKPHTADVLGKIRKRDPETDSQNACHVLAQAEISEWSGLQPRARGTAGHQQSWKKQGLPRVSEEDDLDFGLLASGLRQRRFCSSRCPVYGALLQQRQGTNTVEQRSPMLSLSFFFDDLSVQFYSKME